MFKFFGATYFRDFTVFINPYTDGHGYSAKLPLKLPHD